MHKKLQAAAVAAFLAAGCGADTQDSESLPPSNSVIEVEAEVPLGSSSEGGGNAESSLGSQGNEPIPDWVLRDVLARLREDAAVRVRDCMAGRGFPQLREAELIVREATISYASHPLYIDPLEFGPTTLQQAELFGLVGIKLVNDGPEPGAVRSNDPAYSKNLETCRDEVDGHGGADINELETQSIALANELRGELLFAIEEPIQSLMNERLSCLAERVGLDEDVVAQTGGPEDLLLALGVQPGEIDSGVAKANLDALGPAETVVVPPSPARTYIPTVGEVEVAIQFVECGTAIDFIDRLLDVQSTARETLLERHGLQIAEIEAQTSEIAARLSR